MDGFDRKLLNVIQNDFPVDSEPYAKLAEELGSSVSEVMKRIHQLKEKEIIRRIGAVFDPRKLGFISVLAAAQVPEADIDSFAAVVKEFHEITHIYVRNASVNLWFTISAASQDRLDEILMAIKSQTGIEVHLLPAEKIFKVKVVFQF